MPECYANRCLADELARMLRRRIGRDRIVSRVLKSPLTGRLLIAVIDYERGVSRVYIDRHFELEEVADRILIGVARKKPNVMAIVFDPDIENAFLCRVSRQL